MKNLFDKCLDSSKKKKLEKENHFNTIHKGLIESMTDFNETLEVIGNWDELVNLKDESPMDKKLSRNKTIKEELKEKKVILKILDLFFVYSN